MGIEHSKEAGGGCAKEGVFWRKLHCNRAYLVRYLLEETFVCVDNGYYAPAWLQLFAHDQDCNNETSQL